jgi:hypothetical protein
MSHFLSTLLLKIMFVSRKLNKEVLFHVASHGVFRESIPLSQNYRASRTGHCEAASCPAASFWLLWQQRRFFRRQQKFRSSDVKIPHSLTEGSIFCSQLGDSVPYIRKYSSEFGPSQVQLLGSLKNHLGDYSSQNLEEVQESAAQKLSSENTEFCVQNLHYPTKPFVNKRMNFQSDYVEK